MTKVKNWKEFWTRELNEMINTYKQVGEIILGLAESLAEYPKEKLEFLKIVGNILKEKEEPKNE